MTDPQSFGAWLHRERERRGITVHAIAERTKIGASRLAALERGDISRWPEGIYRRAFVRAYADAVGLDADLVLANFERAFPSDPSATSAAVVFAAPVDANEMRLALATPALAGVSASAVKTAGRDIACVLACAFAGYIVGGAVGFWIGAALASITFHLWRVLGLQHWAIWRYVTRASQTAAGETTADVVSFADLSAASSAAMSARRRAARF